MLKKILVLFAAFFSVLSGETLSLKNLIGNAEAGDYVAFSRNKNYTLLVVKNTSPQEITIEEISIPEPLFPKSFRSWRQWLENGAPSHTAKVVYKVDTKSGKLRDYYSYNHNSQINVSETENLFTKLLNLNFSLVPHRERKSITTSSGESKPWNPKMVVDGKQIPGVFFDVWQAKWPSDGSELGGKTVQVYLPEKSPRYPGYFPYWIKIQAAVGKAHLRVVDSGKGLIDNSCLPLK